MGRGLRGSGCVIGNKIVLRVSYGTINTSDGDCIAVVGTVDQITFRASRCIFQFASCILGKSIF